MSAPARDHTVAALDVPREVLEGQLAAQTLDEARAHTNSPSDQIAYALDAWLVTHHDAPLATEADYPDWTPGVRPTAPKEATS